MIRFVLAAIVAAQVAGGVPVSQRRPGVVLENPPGSSDVFVCGTDQTLPNPIPLRASTVILAGDSRLFVACLGDLRDRHVPDHREVRETLVLAAGLQSRIVDERVRAAQALARIPRLQRIQVTVYGQPGNSSFGTGTVLEDNLGDLIKTPAITPACRAETQVFGQPTSILRWQPGRLFQLLSDPSADVQREAAYGIGTRLMAAGRPADLYVAAFNELRVCAVRTTVQTTDEVRGLLLEAIGLAAYATSQQRDEAEAFLVQQATGSIARLLGAARGLEALIRGNPRRQIQDTTRLRLRELAVYGQAAGQPVASDPAVTIRTLAVQSLMAAGDTDPITIRRAAEDDAWQVRRLVAARLDLADRNHASIADRLAQDMAFQVRFDLLGSVSRHVSSTATCAPLAPFLKDYAAAVALRALDALTAKCADLDGMLPAVTSMADRLDGVVELAGPLSWHIPARALTALARVKPELAKARLESASKNAIWQVRATAAAAAAAVQDAGVADALAQDEHPNVRTAALDALFRMKSAAVVPRAIATLESGADHQVLMTAARVLRGLPADAKDAATDALLGALRRLTDDGSDMSRDPRVASLERLGETIRPERASDLQTYVADFDDAVGEAAAKAFTAVVGSAPPAGPKRRRYPFQPLERELLSLPKTATILLDDGLLELELRADVAPVTVARFVQNARSGAYNGKTLHRVVPNFVVQGGSPGANEYSGVAPRFMRDEVGPQARHIRGAVGISTRGPDTGDGQIFIDLVDNPRLDHAYTVFAFVTGTGMELVDRMLEGATIRSVTVK